MTFCHLTSVLILWWSYSCGDLKVEFHCILLEVGRQNIDSPALVAAAEPAAAEHPCSPYVSPLGRRVPGPLDAAVPEPRGLA